MKNNKQKNTFDNYLLIDQIITINKIVVIITNKHLEVTRTRHRQTHQINKRNLLITTIPINSFNINN